ncbi:protein-L-isoaspartate(D-aspartate) O-methyltransferase [Constrictibacter sp. MBR-5]|jgi:protein-L-isoaspartate(D-aspartate) O-methyltransferase|uniref:protein-L-isoaspartate(D-aspartate) O-methyltransferase n=1 Tax=Constrictibacter sp. MBR-5 TaxID=3156467 RepID=UPI0033956D3B
MAKRGIGDIGGIVRGLAALVLPIGIGAAPAAGANDVHAERRAAMVETIRTYPAGSGGLAALALDKRVLDAMRAVPRHDFVPPAQRELAYQDRPLSIGQDQTISQPYIVALMTSLLRPEPGHTVLEVGTGSGYQAAVLARLAARVYTIEIVPELGRQAAAVLSEGYPNVIARIGDGYLGWPEAAPFDGIMVTAAAPSIPQPLIDQLKAGGRMVVPLGQESSVQNLVLVRKDMDGMVSTDSVLPVRFVPLTGQGAGSRPGGSPAGR